MRLRGEAQGPLDGDTDTSTDEDEGPADDDERQPDDRHDDLADNDDQAHQPGHVEVENNDGEDEEHRADEDQDDIEHDDDDDDGPSSGDDEVDPQLYLIHSLRGWAVRGVSKRKVDSLLQILHRLHPHLPLSYKTLLDTPEHTEIQETADGLMWYKGIKRNLDERVDEEYLHAQNGVITLDFNMDGLPMYRCPSNCHFWPILGSLKDRFRDPFIVAVWYGFTDKPSSVNEYLNDFIDELLDMRVNGGYVLHGQVYPIVVRNFICDTPAKSFLKCSIGHNGTYGCDKCEVRGRKYLYRMTFVPTDAELRTDQSFIDRSNAAHHTGMSPLEDLLQIGMVSQFRVDPMHLVYLGVVKRFLNVKLGARNHGRLRDEEIEQFKEDLSAVGAHFPREFNRKPRYFNALRDLKASDCRRFVLYEGIQVLRGLLPPNEYNNFLLLHCFVFILECPLFIQQPAFLDAANEFARLYVEFSHDVYGQEFVVHNVHTLIHLTAESRHTQEVLYLYSSFPYENYLKVIKTTLRSGYLPLQQLARRDAEAKGQLCEPKPVIDGVVLKRGHFDPAEILNGVQFQMVTWNGVSLSLDQGNKCFKTEDGCVVHLTNIIQVGPDNIILRGQRFRRMANYYNYPLDSSVLGIHLVSSLANDVESWPLQNVSCKCILMPQDEESFLCVPMLHTVT